MSTVIDVPTAVHTLPFELAEGHVLLAAAVNGRPATLILDTGSSVTALDAGAFALIPTAAPVQVKGTGDLSVRLATAEAVDVGPLRMANEMVALMPFDAVSAAHGRPIHGT